MAASYKRQVQGSTTETVLISNTSILQNEQNCKKKDLSAVDGRVLDGAATDLASWNLRDTISLAVCLGSGAVFGFVAEKSKVYVPSVIQNQMVFSQFTMLKMFLSAVSAGLGSFSLLCLLPQSRKLFNRVRADFASCVTSKKTAAFALGGVLLGMGMTLSGACPGMVTIQVASGVPNAFVTLAGCFAGAVLYGVVQEPLHGLLFRKRPCPPPSVWLDQRSGYSFLSLSLPLAAGLLAVVMATEYLAPWTSEVPVSASDAGWFSQISWSPILAGGIIGLLQLPVSLAVTSSMGGSSSYCTLLSQSSTVRNRLGYFKNYHTGVENWWQVVYWVGAMLGAGASLYLAGQWGAAEGVSPPLAFLGGMLVLFGARTASGCTSGHGLSGMALLSTSSFIAVPAMFAGAMSLAFFMQ